MFRRPRYRIQLLCWIACAVLGTAFGTTTSCSDATQSAFLTGARSAASALLNTFFDNVAARDSFIPVTVKAVQ